MLILRAYKIVLGKAHKEPVKYLSFVNSGSYLFLKSFFLNLITMTIHEFELIYKSYYHVALYYCGHFNLPNEDLEDIVANVFHTILSDLSNYRVQGIKSFIVTSARNKCIDLIRQNKSKQDYLKTRMEDSHDIQDQIDNADAINKFLSLIKQLPPQQSKVFTLKYIHDRTRSEIAAHLNISPHTVKNTLLNGMKNIKKKIKTGQ